MFKCLVKTLVYCYQSFGELTPGSNKNGPNNEAAPIITLAKGSHYNKATKEVAAQ